MSTKPARAADVTHNQTAATETFGAEKSSTRSQAPKANNKRRAQQVPGPNPQPANQDGSMARSPLPALLAFEASIREAITPRALAHVVANESRKVLRARQSFHVRITRRGRCQITAASGVSTLDPNAPLLRAIESRLRESLRGGDVTAPRRISFDGIANATGTDEAAHTVREPFQLGAQALWTPMVARCGTVFGGVLHVRNDDWSEAEAVFAKRMADASAHAWLALDPRAVRARSGWRGKLLASAIGVAAGLALLIPVPMSALAPVEIVPRDPFVVAAPIDGVIEAVEIDPNATVRVGQPLMRFEDTNVRNKANIAERELRVADARVKRANQEAFSTADGRRELAIARAERDVRLSELAYARALVAKTVVAAQVPGVAVFNDRKDLTGKPVKVGERLLEIADPQRVWLRIEMPVADVSLLKPGANVKVYLDADPLNPMTARLVRADYQAKARHGDQVAFRAWAEPTAKQSGPAPRLGGRGTAQVFGDDVPLGLFLFRRPITAARQWLGL